MQKDLLDFQENCSNRNTFCSSSAASLMWYDGQRDHRLTRDHKVHEHWRNRNFWNSSMATSREEEKNSPGQFDCKVNVSENERNDGFLEGHHQLKQVPVYHTHTSGSTNTLYMNSNSSARNVMANFSPCGPFPTMNSYQWGINPLENMDMKISTFNGLHVTRNMNMTGNLGAGANQFAFMGMAGDPNLFKMMGMGNNDQYGMMETDSSMTIAPAKKEMHLSNSVLYPPHPNAPHPTLREKPLGCKTVFVGGLPENATEEIVKEIFEQCGEILMIRMSKKSFCHIRFAHESFVDNAIYLSGYRLKIDNKGDAPNTGKLHVDYAESTDDQYDFKCYQRSLQRKARHRVKQEQSYCGTFTSVSVSHYSDHKAAVLRDRLRNEESFQQAVSALITWLERGDCNKRNSSYFYSMIQSAYSHVRRLVNEKLKYEDELNKAKMMLKQQTQDILLQFNQIGKVFNAANLQKVWDHFTKAQRKNIELWKKQTEKIKEAHVAEVLNDRIEDEMELSEDEAEDSTKENFGGTTEQNVQSNHAFAGKGFNYVIEENQSLKFQLEAYKNEVVVLRSTIEQERNVYERKIQELTESLQNLEAEMMSQIEKRVKEEAGMKERGACNQQKEDMCKASSLLVPASIFLHSQPSGATLYDICSYLLQYNNTICAKDVETLVKKFPAVFIEDSVEVGLNHQKKFVFSLCGFKSQF